MKRPSTAGLLILLAFSIPVIVEFHTVLAYLGIHVPFELYLPVTVALALLTVTALWLLPEKEEPGNPSKA